VARDLVAGAVRARRVAREEGVDLCSLADAVGVGKRGCSLHPAPRAAGELLCRSRGAAHDGRDRVEVDGEQVVQHEREPLGAIQSHSLVAIRCSNDVRNVVAVIHCV
jgi:hypothetical protein